EGPTLKQHLVRIGLGLAIVLFLVGQALGLYPLRFVTQLDNLIYDARLELTMPRGPEPRIVVLDIDEKSLGELGHWPWRRDLMAQLLDELFEHQRAALVAFDVVWAEHDASSGIDALDRLAREWPSLRPAYARLRAGLDYDARFCRRHERPAGSAGLLLQQRSARRARQCHPKARPAGGQLRGRARRVSPLA